MPHSSGERSTHPRILLLSTSDTDLLSARAADGPVAYRFANPSRLPLDDLPALLEGVGLVVVRLLGGLRAWEEGLDLLLADGRPVVVLTGEQAPDAQLMAASTVPVGIAAEAHAYLAHGGPANLEQLARFLSDTVLLTGHGFDPPAPRHLGPAGAHTPRGHRRPDRRRALLPRPSHERQHRLRPRPVRRRGERGRAAPAAVRGLPARPRIRTDRGLRAADVIVTTVLAAGGTKPAEASAGGERYRTDNGDWPTSVGLSLWGTSAMRTAGDDVAEALALLGIRPVWDDASRRVTGLEAIPYDELGRPRIDVTLRISGFFRDAFPHTVGLLDDAVRLAASLDEPAEANHVRAHVQADLAEHGDERRATTRIFGSRPGTYGAGLLQLIDSRDWRTDADLAEVYTVWGGYAYGRELDGRPARDEMETAYKRIAVAAKNTDTREHDIADSDDYFQYHGGMVAAVRALRGTAPEAYIGDSTRPETVRTRTLVEETSRVFRARVVNPKWIEAMRRHGYKGAFELAATVDYLFGYDATTGVIADWMYDKLTETYVLDPVNREFLQQANPWALHGIAERLLEAESRGMWEKPDPAVLDALRKVYLETEGDLEGED
ncbi:hypothetical protein SHIRM173S_04196 [Streptomyces hirsutus]